MYVCNKFKSLARIGKYVQFGEEFNYLTFESLSPVYKMRKTHRY
jgi:hypothetical protein